MHQPIGLFYGSSTCYTEMAAEKIVDAINKIAGQSFVKLHNIAEDSVQLMANYQYIILGIPTWDYGELQEDWETHWDSLDSLDLSRKNSTVWSWRSNRLPTMVSRCHGLLVGLSGSRSHLRWPLA